MYREALLKKQHVKSKHEDEQEDERPEHENENEKRQQHLLCDNTSVS